MLGLLLLCEVYTDFVLLIMRIVSECRSLPKACEIMRITGSQDHRSNLGLSLCPSSCQDDR